MDRQGRPRERRPAARCRNAGRTSNLAAEPAPDDRTGARHARTAAARRTSWNSCAAANPCVIASNRPDGQPVSVATWYLLEDDGRILVNMDAAGAGCSYLRARSAGHR